MVICKQQSELQSPTAPQHQVPRVERHIPPQQITAIAGDLICHHLLKRNMLCKQPGSSITAF